MLQLLILIVLKSPLFISTHLLNGDLFIMETPLTYNSILMTNSSKGKLFFLFHLTYCLLHLKIRNTD